MAADHTPLLRPLGLGDVLDEVFALYRRGFKTFIGIAALVHVPLTILTLPLVPAYTTFLERLRDASGEVGPALAAFDEWMLGLGILVLVGVVVGAILELAATCYATSALYLGETPSIGDAYRQALGRFWALFRLGLLMAALLLGLTVLGVLSWIPLFFLPLLLCVSLPAVFLASIYLPVLWSLATPVLVLEGRPSAVGALGRSGALVRGAWWRTFATLFLLAVLLLILQLIASALVSALVAGLEAILAPGDTGQPVWAAVLSSLLHSGVNLLFGPFFWIGVTLYYYDRRIRAEAYDLAIMARELAQSQQADPTAP